MSCSASSIALISCILSIANRFSVGMLAGGETEGLAAYAGAAVPDDMITNQRSLRDADPALAQIARSTVKHLQAHCLPTSQEWLGIVTKVGSTDEVTEATHIVQAAELQMWHVGGRFQQEIVVPAVLRIKVLHQASLALMMP